MKPTIGGMVALFGILVTAQAAEEPPLSSNEKLVRAMEPDELCDWWVQRPRDYTEAEIIRRKLFPPADWQRIKFGKGAILVGDSKIIVTCSLGLPQRKNVTEPARGTTEQWVYGNGIYVYFAGNTVAAIQH